MTDWAKGSSGAESLARRIEEIWRDPAASDWLKGAIAALLKRDPVDAANDCDVLQSLMTAMAAQYPGVKVAERS